MGIAGDNNSRIRSLLPLLVSSHCPSLQVLTSTWLLTNAPLAPDGRRILDSIQALRRPTSFTSSRDGRKPHVHGHAGVGQACNIRHTARRDRSAFRRGTSIAVR